MTKKRKIFQTLIKCLFVGLIPFVAAGMDTRSIDFPITGLAIILVPSIWLSLIIWDLRATKAAKMGASVNLTTSIETTIDVSGKPALVVKGTKVSHTLMKALVVTVALVLLAWVGLRLEPFIHGITIIGLPVFLLPWIWWWLFVEHNSVDRGHAYPPDFSGNVINLSGHNRNTNSEMGPGFSIMEHNPLSDQKFQAPVMTRTPDYSLGPDSGMYTTRWH